MILHTFNSVFFLTEKLLVGKKKINFRKLFYLLVNLWARYLECVLSEVGHDVEKHDGQHAQQVHPLHRLLHGQKGLVHQKGKCSMDKRALFTKRANAPWTKGPCSPKGQMLHGQKGLVHQKGTCSMDKRALFTKRANAP
jgi:hypothetical protein